MDFLNFSNIFTSVLYSFAWFSKAEVCSLTKPNCKYQTGSTNALSVGH